MNRQKKNEYAFLDLDRHKTVKDGIVSFKEEKYEEIKRRYK